MRRALVVVALLLGSCGGASAPMARLGPEPPAAPPTDNWGATVDRLAAELAGSLRYEGTGRLKAAVINFTTPEGGPCSVGAVLAEELTTRLFQSGRFDVVERRLLQRVLEEQQLSATDLLDPDSVARVGRVLGAGAVVTGTIAESEGVARINARIVLVENGSIVSVASATISGRTVRQVGRCGDEIDAGNGRSRRDASPRTERTSTASGPTAPLAVQDSQGSGCGGGYRPGVAYVGAAAGGIENVGINRVQIEPFPDSNPSHSGLVEIMMNGQTVRVCGGQTTAGPDGQTLWFRPEGFNGRSHMMYLPVDPPGSAVDVQCRLWVRSVAGQLTPLPAGRVETARASSDESSWWPLRCFSP